MATAQRHQNVAAERTYPPAGAVVDRGDRSVGVEVDRGEHDAGVVRARRAVRQRPAERREHLLEASAAALVGLGTARRGCAPRSRRRQREYSQVRVVAAAPRRLRAHRPAAARPVADGDPDAAAVLARSRRRCTTGRGPRRAARRTPRRSRPTRRSTMRSQSTVTSLPWPSISVAGPDRHLPRVHGARPPARHAADLRAADDAPAVQQPVVAAQALEEVVGARG